MENKLKQAFSSVISILKLRNSFQVGSLNQICSIIEQNPSQLEQSLENNVIDFLTTISEFVRQKNDSKAQSLAIMVIQSLIFNLYAKNKQTDKLRLNNSFYHSMAMSTSQMSMEMGSEQQITKTDEVNKLATFIQSVIVNKKFSKKLKVISQRHPHKARNSKYIEILFQTMEYIMNKQEQVKDNFYDIKKPFTIAIISKQDIKFNYETVNAIIFSNCLNRIVFMLTEAPDEVLFALTRIYYVGCTEQDRRNLRGVSYSTSDMLYNLHRLYINSFAYRTDVFKQGKNPLYKLIVSQLECFYMPQFLKFNKIVIKCSKNNIENMEHFLRIAQQIVIDDLVQFINELPHQIIRFFHQLFCLIEQQFLSDKGASCTQVKKLFLYSFLVKPDLVEELLIHEQDFSQYQMTCNYILNLFFSTSVKKFPQEYADEMNHLIQKVSVKFDERIINGIQNFNNDCNTQYFLEQPIINDDYQILANFIKEKEFTPKDMKQFIMKKPHEIQSPNKPHAISQIMQSPFPNQLKNNTNIRSKQINEEDLDLSTWMTLGGHQDWTNIQSHKNNKTKNKKLIFETFPKEKMAQVQRLSRKLEDIIKYDYK